MAELRPAIDLDCLWITLALRSKTETHHAPMVLGGGLTCG